MTLASDTKYGDRRRTVRVARAAASDLPFDPSRRLNGRSLAPHASERPFTPGAAASGGKLAVGSRSSGAPTSAGGAYVRRGTTTSAGGAYAAAGAYAAGSASASPAIVSRRRHRFTAYFRVASGTASPHASAASVARLST